MSSRYEVLAKNNGNETINENHSRDEVQMQILVGLKSGKNSKEFISGSNMRKAEALVASQIQNPLTQEASHSGSAQFSPTSTFFLDRNQEVPLSTSLK
ncbi:hypothetical protein PIB30_078669, partial [Stylosanthes scabra]|nr:hypothetical protein [Stylosanthes scabra]